MIARRQSDRRRSDTDVLAIHVDNSIGGGWIDQQQWLLIFPAGFFCGFQFCGCLPCSFQIRGCRSRSLLIIFQLLSVFLCDLCTFPVILGVLLKDWLEAQARIARFPCNGSLFLIGFCINNATI